MHSLNPIRLRLALLSMVLVSFFGWCELASAQPSIRNSTWRTSYGRFHGGRKTKAVLTFQGRRGYYETRHGTGRLYDIHYTELGHGKHLIAAKWSFLGQRGWVHFHVDLSKRVLVGHWGRDDRIEGYWDAKATGERRAYPQGPRRQTQHPSNLPPV